MTALRSYATAGVALMGAGAIAITPITPTLPTVEVTHPAVQLSAAVDPITPLRELFNNTEVNFASLVNTWLEAPSPVLQQIIVNQLTYLSELPDVGLILDQIGTNTKAALNTLVAADLDALTPTGAAFYELIPMIMELPPELQPIVDFTTTYLSGALIGLVGPVLAPVVALGASISSILGQLTAENPDLGAAVNTLINIPTKMVDAFLNGGQTVDLTPVLEALGVQLDIGGGITAKVGLTLGGLLSPGGALLNALSLTMLADGEPIGDLPGQAVGTIGSLVSLAQAIAKAIGWDGTGNPLAPADPVPSIAPLTERAATDPGTVPAALLDAPAPSTTVDLTDSTAGDGAAGADLTKVTLVSDTEDSTDAPAQPAAGDAVQDAVKSAGQKVSEAISDAGRTLKDRADKAAEKRAEKKAERAEKRAEKQAERAEKRAAKQAAGSSGSSGSAGSSGSSGSSSSED
ncbi:outer membrane porin GjpA [Mycolicibacterium confluentis]|uniref:Uncharacterized protein n=1 Tax=Mycolicibacterium confluentis TaxID=28047 RepID=A0A7I7Y4V5_9MYCO|nr:outer membrane porin GjpA [Mycolicibacterium confluentis]MCV7319094.1 outer membrane porin GjpA [Mycolicibacterium confluentis]ORV24818.1 hypothetical protein AWB99_04795 [Mycolicibacterium confluentis]BBZ36707.1 hypothetical protein MCNF_53120 [Mycolicibacterium confluentis]